MNLYSIGHTVLNMDRVNGILDPPLTAEPGASGHTDALRVLFDSGHIDLTGHEARTFRHWYRHIARNLDPHKDESGEELIAPADQVRRCAEMLLRLVDQAQPRHPPLRRAAHHLGEVLDRYLTGELPPVRARDFESGLAPRMTATES